MRRKGASMLLRPPQIPCDLNFNWTLAATADLRQLIASALANRVWTLLGVPMLGSYTPTAIRLPLKEK
jgi:hypothetical protein